MTLQRLARLFLKISGYLFLAVVAVVLLWFVANRLFDEPLNPSAAALDIAPTERLPDSRNIAVGILGITAPRGANIFSYGSSVLAMYRNGSWQVVRNMQEGPNTLQPTVGSDQASCWLEPDGPLYFKTCLPFDRASAALKENEELLGRYTSLYKLDTLQADYNYYNRAFLVLAKLAVANMQLALQRHEYESAYERWREQFAFVRTSLHGTDTWVGKAITLVEFGVSFSFFEDLLNASPQTLLSHREELAGLLKPDGLDAINVHGLVRGEYVSLVRSLGSRRYAPSYRTEPLYWLVLHVGQKNRILNRYSSFLKEYEEALVQPWPEVGKRFETLRARYVRSADDRDFLIDPIGTIFLAVEIEGQLKSIELLRQSRIYEGRLRLATLALQLLESRTSDENVPKFLAAANTSLRDPFTGEPMRWDAVSRRIYFPDPSDKCAAISLRISGISDAALSSPKSRICR